MLEYMLDMFHGYYSVIVVNVIFWAKMTIFCWNDLIESKVSQLVDLIEGETPSKFPTFPTFSNVLEKGSKFAKIFSNIQNGVCVTCYTTGKSPQ